MASGRRRILVVDDEPGLQRLVQRRAEAAGFEVLQAATGAEGLALAASENPDLILLDQHLPDANGVDLLSRLKADPRTTHIPVVAWSGSDAAESEVASLRAGAASYFEKTELRGLMARISELLRSAGTVQRPK